MPGLHADLAEPDEIRAALLQLAVEAVHVRVQFVHVGILAADLADFTADGNGDSSRFGPADERGEVGRERDVHLLLLGQRRLVEVDERRGVDVDVIEAGGNLFLDERAQRLDLLVAVGAVVFLGVRLDVIALDEDGATEAFAQRGGDAPPRRTRADAVPCIRFRIGRSRKSTRRR